MAFLGAPLVPLARPLRRGRTSPQRPRQLPQPSMHAATEPGAAPGAQPRRRPRRTRGPSVFLRAQQLASRGYFDRARGLLRAHVTEHGDDARAWLALAKMQAGARSLAVFAEGAAQCPRSVHLLHAYAVECGRAGRLADARRLFRSCLDLAPGDGVVWQAFALLEERNGEPSRAEALFATGVEHDPDNASLWSAWGAMAQRRRDHESAVPRFAAAVRCAPRDVRTLQMWAISAEKLGDFPESRSLFERALDADPSSVPTLQAFALFCARRRRFDRARELFKAAIDADPGHAAAFHAWAQMERQEGNFADARSLFDQGVRADPLSAPMLRAWAAMELDLGHIDKSSTWRVPGSKARGHRRSRQPARRPPKGKEEPERRRQLTDVGENLRMLRLLIERRSDEDVSTVMQWLHRRAEDDRELKNVLVERSGDDARVLRDWVGRRSEEDVSAFKRWVEDRYESDRSIGVYIFNWDVPAARKETVPVPVPVEEPVEDETPQEWFRLAETPVQSLAEADRELFTSEERMDYIRGVYFMGQIASSFADRAALVFVLGTLTLGLIGFSAHLEDLGYSPAGDQTAPEGVVEIAPPSGVDAYMYKEGGPDLEEVATAGGTLRKSN